MVIHGDSRPVRCDGLRCRVVGEEALLHDVRRDATLRLNSLAYLIWEQCDGRKTCSSIAEGLLEEWDGSAEQAQADVLGAIRQMARHKLVDVLR